ncbi:hypothetical protein T484DRAFT_1754812 [Baffinella frigidus]|nr:hypothetical protein T484DRAFT_1754812 [Cryptophyta sp. CCMP2293]
MKVHNGLKHIDASCGSLGYEQAELVLATLSEEAQDCPAYRYNGIPTKEDIRGLIPNDDTTNTSQRNDNQTPEQRVTRQKKAYADQRRDRMIMLPKTAQVEFKQIESNVISGSQMTSFSCKEEKKVRPGHQNWYDIHVRADVFREEVKKARLARDAADELMKTQSVVNANADTQLLTYEQSGGYRFMAWPECSNNTSEHYEISVPVLLKPSNITYRSALGDERTSKMTPDLAKKYNKLFHDVCCRCAAIHAKFQKPVWKDYQHTQRSKKDSRETATVSTVPNASDTDESTVPKEDEKDEYKEKLDKCRDDRRAAMLADAGCKNMIVAFFETMTSTENLVANGRTQYTSLDNFTTHILSDADHVCGQTIGKHTVLASLVECEESPLFMEWLRQTENKKYAENPGMKTAKQVRLQQAYEFGASNGVQVLRGEGDGLDPASEAFVPGPVPGHVPGPHDTDTVAEDVERYSIFCTRKREDTTTAKTDVIGDGHFYDARHFAFDAARMARECQLIRMNPNSAAAATAKDVAYDIHKQLMESSVSNKLLHLLLHHVKYAYESLKCGTVLRDTLVAKAFVDMHCFLFKLQDKEFSLDVDIPEEVKRLNVFKSYNLVIRHGKVLECESTGLNFAHHLVHMCSYEHMRCVIGRLGMGVIPKASPVMLKHAHETSITRAKGWCKTNSHGSRVFTANPYHNLMKAPDTHRCTEWPKTPTGGDGTDRQPVATVQPTIESSDRPGSVANDTADPDPPNNPAARGRDWTPPRRQQNRETGGAEWSGNGDDADVLF